MAQPYPYQKHGTPQTKVTKVAGAKAASLPKNSSKNNNSNNSASSVAIAKKKKALLREEALLYESIYDEGSVVSALRESLLASFADLEEDTNNNNNNRPASAESQGVDSVSSGLSWLLNLNEQSYVANSLDALDHPESVEIFDGGVQGNNNSSGSSGGSNINSNSNSANNSLHLLPMATSFSSASTNAAVAAAIAHGLPIPKEKKKATTNKQQAQPPIEGFQAWSSQDETDSSAAKEVSLVSLMQQQKARPLPTTKLTKAELSRLKSPYMIHKRARQRQEEKAHMLREMEQNNNSSSFGNEDQYAASVAASSSQRQHSGSSSNSNIGNLRAVLDGATATTQVTDVRTKSEMRADIATIISQEAAMQNKAKMIGALAPSSDNANRNAFSTRLEVTTGIFDDLRKTKDKLKEGRLLNKLKKEETERTVRDSQQQIVASSSSSHQADWQPPSNQDPLYRIMREEAEYAHKKKLEEASTIESEFASSFLLPPANGNKRATTPTQQAAVYDKEKRLLLLEQAAHDKALIRDDLLVTLRLFGALSPDMWVTMRVVYFLIVCYFELIVLPNGAFSEEADVISLALDKSSFTALPPVEGAHSGNAAVEMSDDTYLSSKGNSANMELFWGIVSAQCSNLDITVSTACDRFSWPLLQTLLKFPVEFSIALVLIERGESVDLRSLEAADAGDLWRRGKMYRVFPEEHLSLLRAVTKPAVFFPTKTVRKSLCCARLCSWARRITAGLFAAKANTIRHTTVPLELANDPHIAFSGGNLLVAPQKISIDGAAVDATASSKDAGTTPSTKVQLLEDGSVSAASFENSSTSMQGSVFANTNLSSKSPKKRVEQFISYRGTQAGSGASILVHPIGALPDMPSEEKHGPMVIVTAIPFAITKHTGHECPLLAYHHVLEQTLAMARPLDHIEMLLLPMASVDDDLLPAYLDNARGVYGGGGGIGMGNAAYLFEEDEAANVSEQLVLQQQQQQQQLAFVRGLEVGLSAKEYYQTRIMNCSRSPLHRVKYFASTATTTASASPSVPLEDPVLLPGKIQQVYVSFTASAAYNTRIASSSSLSSSFILQNEQGVHVDGNDANDFVLSYATTVAQTDLLIVDHKGLERSYSKQPTADQRIGKVVCSVALVKPQGVVTASSSASLATFVTNRYLVCISDSAASRAAFRLTLRLARQCDLIFLLHVVGSKGEEGAAGLVAEYRSLGYNLHVEMSNESEQRDSSSSFARRVFELAKDFEPTHLALGADGRDVDFALYGSLNSPASDDEASPSLEMSFAQSMISIDEAGSSVNTLLLACVKGKTYVSSKRASSTKG